MKTMQRLREAARKGALKVKILFRSLTGCCGPQYEVPYNVADQSDQDSDQLQSKLIPCPDVEDTDVEETHLEDRDIQEPDSRGAELRELDTKETDLQERDPNETDIQEESLQESVQGTEQEAGQETDQDTAAWLVGGFPPVPDSRYNEDVQGYVCGLPTFDIGTYPMEVALGSGAFGKVGRHTVEGRPMAFKVQEKATCTGTMDLIREAYIGALCGSSHMAKCLGIVVQEGAYIGIALELGQMTLAAFVHHVPGKLLPRMTVLSIAEQIAVGLEGFHQQGYMHRDIKPTNIMVSNVPADPLQSCQMQQIKSVKPEVMLIDTGLAIRADEPVDSGPYYPPYSSPEKVIGPRVTNELAEDIFSFGAVFLELVKHSAECPPQMYPDEGSVAAGFRAHTLYTKTPGLEDCSAGTADIIMRCLRYDPLERPTIGEVLESIRVEKTQSQQEVNTATAHAATRRKQAAEAKKAQMNRKKGGAGKDEDLLRSPRKRRT